MLEKWYKEQGKDAHFFVVYIREAHPADGRWPVRGAPKDPKNLLQREIVASQCVKDMKLSIPFVIDDMKDTANKAYAAWPDRIYIIDRDGKIAYKAGRGPWGFKPKAARKKLTEMIGEKAPAKPTKKKFY